MAIYLSKTQFSLVTSKPNFHWQHQNPILIGNIKAQFSLAISKAQLTLALFKTQFSLANIKAQFSLATSKAQLMLALFKIQFSLATSKAQFSLVISKAQLALTLLKTQANYLALSYQKPKVIKYLAKYYIIIISLKSPIINNTLNS